MQEASDLDELWADEPILGDDYEYYESELPYGLDGGTQSPSPTSPPPGPEPGTRGHSGSGDMVRLELGKESPNGPQFARGGSPVWALLEPPADGRADDFESLFRRFTGEKVNVAELRALHEGLFVKFFGTWKGLPRVYKRKKGEYLRIFDDHLLEIKATLSEPTGLDAFCRLLVMDRPGKDRIARMNEKLSRVWHPSH